MRRGAVATPALGSLFFNVNLRGYPQPLRGVHSPAIEMKVALGGGSAGRRWLYVGTIKTHDGVVAILHPYTAHEFSRRLATDRRHVEHQAADFAQKLAPDVFKAISPAVEIVEIEHGHLRKTAWQKHECRVLRACRTEGQPGTGLSRRRIGTCHQRLIVDHAVPADAPQEIMIIAGPRRGVASLGCFLNVGFGHRRSRRNRRQKSVLAFDNAIEQFFD